jgi:hypothetical protein
MEALLIAVAGTLNIACFLIGIKVGQSTAKGEDVKTPSVNPVNVVRRTKESRENEEAEAENKKLEVVLQNIENYDGTDMGQQDIPL